MTAYNAVKLMTIAARPVEVYAHEMTGAQYEVHLGT